MIWNFLTEMMMCMFSTITWLMHSMHPQKKKVYCSAIIWDELSDDIPVEYLNAINLSGLPVSKLTPKVGCPVILLCNLFTHNGLCNGTRAIVAILKDRVVGINPIHHGQLAADITWIPHLTLEPSEQGEFHFTLRRRQLPLALAFAMTINKSQGQGADVVGIDLWVPHMDNSMWHAHGLQVDRENIITRWCADHY